MTEYELLSLFTQELELTNTYVMSFVSILFAFVIAIFFVGQKLPKWVLFVVTGIYSVFVFISGLGILLTNFRLALIREEMSLLPADSIGPIVQALISSIPDSAGFLILLFVLLGASYAGSIAFLVYILRQKSTKIS